MTAPRHTNVAEVVPAGRAHAAVIATLHRETIGPAWSADSVSRLLALPGSVAILAVAAATPVGFLLIVPAGEIADLAAIGVLPTHRRDGIGRALLARGLAAARAAGYRRLTLEVAAGNRPARALYHTFGMAEAGRRPQYYPPRNERPGDDAIVLTIELQENTV